MTEAEKDVDSGYTLLYWPGIKGRIKHIRLAFEYAHIPYKQDLDPKSFMKFIRDPQAASPGPYALAPPMLLHNGVLLTQTPNILLYLGDTLGLSGSEPLHKYLVNQLCLTVLDLNTEIHDSHHPIAVSAYYEDQKQEAASKSKNVREERLPKFLGYFSSVINANATRSGYLVGDKVSYADLALFQVIDGCQYAFPKCMKRLEKVDKLKSAFELKKRIENCEQLAEYLKSDRRLPYSNGIFRYYPELDDE